MLNPLFFSRIKIQPEVALAIKKARNYVLGMMKAKKCTFTISNRSAPIHNYF